MNKIIFQLASSDVDDKNGPFGSVNMKCMDFELPSYIRRRLKHALYIRQIGWAVYKSSHDKSFLSIVHWRDYRMIHQYLSSSQNSALLVKYTTEYQRQIQ